MDYGVCGVDCELCGPDSTHRTENCVFLFYKRHPLVRDGGRDNPEFLALIDRAATDEERWAAMVAGRTALMARLRLYYQPELKWQGTRTVHNVASVEEMISIIQRLPDVNDVDVDWTDTGGYRLATFQGAREQPSPAS
jgi:hypothetical protein